MFQIQLINMVLSLERRLDIEDERRGNKARRQTADDAMLFEACYDEMKTIFEKMWAGRRTAKPVQNCLPQLHCHEIIQGK